MRTQRYMRVEVLAVTLMAAAAATSLAQTPAETRPAEASEGVAELRYIEPRAEKVMQAMCAHLNGLRAFRFETENAFDTVEPGGQKLQFSRRVQVNCRRPNKVSGASIGDPDWDVGYWFDGKHITILNRKLNVYSQVETPATIDAMLDHMNTRYGMAVPTADFLFSDVCAVLLADVRTGRYLGEHRVGDAQCHHLAFQQESIDWQIWIDTGEKPWPRKLVVTYKQDDGCPQFSATFLKWDPDAKLADADFVFTPPKDAEQIELVAVDADENMDEESMSDAETGDSEE